MKYCTKCGMGLFEEAVVCPGCGCPCETERQQKPRVDEKKKIWIIILFSSFVVFAVIAIICGLSDTFIRNCDKYQYYLSYYGTVGRSAAELASLLEEAKTHIIPYVVAICVTGAISLASLVSGLVLYFKKSKN